MEYSDFIVRRISSVSNVLLMPAGELVSSCLGMPSDSRLDHALFNTTVSFLLFPTPYMNLIVPYQ
jgi:hypothetical protein